MRELISSRITDVLNGLILLIDDLIRGNWHSETSLIEERFLVPLGLLVGHSREWRVDEMEGFKEVFPERLQQPIRFPHANRYARGHQLCLTEAINLAQSPVGIRRFRSHAHDVGKWRAWFEGDGKLGNVVVAEGKLAGRVARLLRDGDGGQKSEKEEENHFVYRQQMMMNDAEREARR